MERSQEVVAAYFRSKQKELNALAEIAVCQHPSLKGSHREEVFRTYLSQILPKRYSVGRGMIYEATARSCEADIVIWDSQNFPSLPMLDHSFFFAESVRGVIEVKSNWSADNFRDALKKSQSVRKIDPVFEPSLSDVLLKMQVDLEYLKEGYEYSGILQVKQRIGTCVIFLNGGTETDPTAIFNFCEESVDLCWPDLIVLLQPGIVVKRGTKNNEGVEECLQFLKFGENALLAFTSELLNILDDRVVHNEGRFSLEGYAFPYLDGELLYETDFKLLRLSAGNIIL